MTSLVRLYPRDWRDRYEDEFLSLLAERPPDARDRVDIVRGAIDARIRPQVRAARSSPVRTAPSASRLVAGPRGARRCRCRPLARRARHLRSTARIVVDSGGSYRDGAAALPFVIARLRPARRRARPDRPEPAAWVRRRRTRRRGRCRRRRGLGHDAVGPSAIHRRLASATSPWRSRRRRAGVLGMGDAALIVGGRRSRGASSSSPWSGSATRSRRTSIPPTCSSGSRSRRSGSPSATR